MSYRHIELNGQMVRISEEDEEKWLNSPASVRVDDGTHHSSNSDTRGLFRQAAGFTAAQVSKEVHALGKVPFPALKSVLGIKRSGATKKEEVYDNRMAWMGSSPLLKYMTPGELNWRGVINMNPNLQVSDRFKVNARTVKALQDSASDPTLPRPILDNITGIHPIFRRQNWPNTPDVVFEYLKPSIRIASKILQMETVLALFYASGDDKNWNEEPKNDFMRKHESKTQSQVDYYCTINPVPLDNNKTRDIMKDLVDMQSYIQFLFRALPFRVEAETQPRLQGKQEMPGLRRHRNKTSVAARMILNPKWAEYLEPGAKVASQILPGADDASALLRAQFNFALTLVHEFAHAWHYNVMRQGDFDEPFRGSDRVAEAGYALEAQIMGDLLIEASGNNPCLSGAPFGFSSRKWPGDRWMDNNFEIEPHKGTAPAHGVFHYTHYGVPMDYIHQFFTNDFWNRRVERFGQGAVRMPKPFGIRMRITQRIDKDTETPFMASLRIGKDPDLSPDGLHPEVKEGLLFDNWAQSFRNEDLDPRTGRTLVTDYGDAPGVENVMKRINNRSKYEPDRILPGQWGAENCASASPADIAAAIAANTNVASSQQVPSNPQTTDVQNLTTNQSQYTAINQQPPILQPAPLNIWPAQTIVPPTPAKSASPPGSGSHTSFVNAFAALNTAGNSGDGSHANSAAGTPTSPPGKNKKGKTLNKVKTFIKGVTKKEAKKKQVMSMNGSQTIEIGGVAFL